MNLLGTANWNLFRDLMRDAHDTFNQDILIWLKHSAEVPRWQEEINLDLATPIQLKCLMGYNFFRTWPITKHDQAGELDIQNMLVYLNKEYLGELGYLNSSGYFNFRPDKDYFIHRGIKYKAEGDTFLSQAYDDPIFIQLILRREEVLVGEEKYNIVTDKEVIHIPDTLSLLLKSINPEILTP